MATIKTNNLKERAEKARLLADELSHDAVVLTEMAEQFESFDPTIGVDESLAIYDVRDAGVDMTTNENAGRKTRLTLADVEEHPIPDRTELVTRDGKSRERVLSDIVEHLHYRFAGNRAEDIVRGNEAADGVYERQSLEAVAAGGDGDAIGVEVLQEDVEVIAIELLGLLWRLEDAGIISRTETIVDSANTPAKPAIPYCSGCNWDDKPWHDLYLTLETSGEAWTHFFYESEDNDDTLEGLSDLAYFINNHNWINPAYMAIVAERLNLMERLYKS